MSQRMLASGNEAIAMAAFDCGVHLGVGYPGTPSSEILENFSAIGGSAEWAPNEKCALEVGIGVAFANGRSLVTMKHVGVNVAADPLFTIAYSGTPGGLVLVSADDPGMASSQNEQDNRRYETDKCKRLGYFDSCAAYHQRITSESLNDESSKAITSHIYKRKLSFEFLVLSIYK